MAQNIESVDKQTLAINNAATVPSGLTNQVSSLSTTCYRCGKSNHTTSQCRYKDVDCLKCGKRCHLKAVCRSKGPMTGRPPVRVFTRVRHPNGENIALDHREQNI